MSDPTQILTLFRTAFNANQAITDNSQSDSQRAAAFASLVSAFQLFVANNPELLVATRLFGVTGLSLSFNNDLAAYNAATTPEGKVEAAGPMFWNIRQG